MSPEFPFYYTINSYADWVNLSIMDQILLFAIAVAITVLALTLTYWIVKGSLYLTYYIIKLSLYITYYSVKLSLLIPFAILRLTFDLIAHSSRPILVAEKSPQDLDTSSVMTADHESSSENAIRYCSQCGVQFTTAMEEIMHKTGNCFCERCGVKAEIRS